MSVMTENPDHYLWVEKYRPTKLSDLIVTDEVRKELLNYIKIGEFPHLLMTGSPGIGKTTLFRVLCHEIGCEYMVINASSDASIDLIRDRVSLFAKTRTSMKGKKAILFDEADGVSSQNFWFAIRPVIEQYSNNCRMVFTGNYVDKIPEPIYDRLTKIDLISGSKSDLAKQMFARIAFILDAEKIPYDKKIIMELVKARFPSLRSMIKLCQQWQLSLTSDRMKYRFGGRDISGLLEAMKNFNFPQLRELVSTEFECSETVYTDLYQNLKGFIEEASLPTAIILLDDYSRSHHQCTNKEIHIVSMLIEFVQKVKLKK